MLFDLALVARCRRFHVILPFKKGQVFTWHSLWNMQYRKHIYICYLNETDDYSRETTGVTFKGRLRTPGWMNSISLYAYEKVAQCRFDEASGGHGRRAQ